MTKDFDPSPFIGCRVRFNVQGEGKECPTVQGQLSTHSFFTEHAGILEVYNPGTESLVFKHLSVDCEGEPVSDYRFYKNELWPVKGTRARMVRDDSGQWKEFNDKVGNNKLAIAKLEVEEQEEPVKEKQVQSLKLVSKLDDEPWLHENKHMRRFGHILNGHPSSTGSSDPLTSSNESGSSGESIPSPPKSTISDRSNVSTSGNYTTDPNLPRAPIQAIRDLFEKCELEAAKADSDDEWHERGEEALKEIDDDVNYWPLTEDLPSISGIEFVDLRKSRFDDESKNDELTSELINFGQIAIDVFGESIQRNVPVEFIAICGRYETDTDNFDMKIFLLPLQLTGKITPTTQRVAGILKNVFGSTKITKLVHHCIAMSEALNLRHGIDIRLPKKHLVDTSVMDAKNKMDQILWKRSRGHQIKTTDETMKSLEDCIKEYLDLDFTAEHFPNLGKQDEYLCLKSEPELSNAAKNFLIRKVALLFPLQEEITDRLFGVIDTGTQLMASKFVTLSERQANELRLRYEHEGVQSVSILQSEDSYLKDLDKITGMSVNELRNGHVPSGLCRKQPPSTNGHSVNQSLTNGHVTNGTMNGVIMNGHDKSKGAIPKSRSHPHQRLNLDDGHHIASSNLGEVPSSSSSLSDGHLSSSPDQPYPTMHDCLNKLHPQRSLRVKEEINWGTVSVIRLCDYLFINCFELARHSDEIIATGRERIQVVEKPSRRTEPDGN